MILLIRILPLLVGCLEAAFFWWQRSLPGIYPWLVLAGLAVFVLAAGAIAWNRLGRSELLEVMAPQFLHLAALGFALLLVEGTLPFSVLMVLAAVSSFVWLELLFLHARNPGAYPLNGLQHLNLALVPLTVWYAVSTSIGLLVFLHVDGYWHVLMLAGLGGVLFATTGHRDSTAIQRRTWTLVGGIVGLELGFLGLLLPVSMAVQGVLAALLLAGTMRVRRYLYDPKPPVRMAVAELVLALVIFISSLLSSKWL